MRMQDHAGSSGRLHTTTPIPPPQPHCLRAVLGLAGSLVLPTTAGFGPTLVAAGRSRRRGLRAARRGAAGTSRRAARARRQCPWAAGSPSRRASQAPPFEFCQHGAQVAKSLTHRTAKRMYTETVPCRREQVRSSAPVMQVCEPGDDRPGTPAHEDCNVVERHAEHTRADSLHNHA